MIDTNVKGTIYTIRAALPHLLQSDGADIVTDRFGGGASRPAVRGGTAPRSSRRWGSRVLWTTSSDRRASRARTCVPAAWRPSSRWAGVERPRCLSLAGMMSAEDVAEAVLFVLTRPRNHRILEMAFRPVTEDSWG